MLNLEWTPIPEGLQHPEFVRKPIIFYGNVCLRQNQEGIITKFGNSEKDGNSKNTGIRRKVIKINISALN